MFECSPNTYAQIFYYLEESQLNSAITTANLQGRVMFTGLMKIRVADYL